MANQSQIDYQTAMQLFDSEVTIQYQNHMRLEGTIEERHGTRGTTLNVPISDILDMTQSNFAPTDIPVTPFLSTNRPINTNDYHLKTVIGGGEETLYAFDTIQMHARTHAIGCARMEDFIKLNAIYADPNFNQIQVVPKTIGYSTGMNAGKMSAALSTLESQGVDVQNYHVSLWLPALLKTGFFADDKVTNFFYNDVKPYTNNRIQGYLGVDIRSIGENGINRIPSTAITGGFEYLVPMVSHDSMIQTFNRDRRTSMTYVEQEDRWEIVSVLTSGAGIIQYAGIVLITADTNYVVNPGN